MKNAEIKKGIYAIICIAAKNHGQAFGRPRKGKVRRVEADSTFRLAGVQMTIMQNLQYAEHLSEPMAELVTILAKEFDYAQLGEEVLRCVSSR